MKATALKRFPLSYVLSLILLFVAHALLRMHFKNLNLSDSSQYFHLALSKIVSQFGFVTGLPQVPSLKWGNQFFDPNPLYTRLTALSFQLLGNRGIALFSLLSAMGFLWSLFWISINWVPPLLGLTLCLCFAAAPELARVLTATTPALLEYLCFLWLLYSFLKGRLLLFCLSLLLYGLSTANFHIAVSLVLLYPFANTKNNKPNFSAVGPMLCSVLFCIYFHPYLPAQFNALYTHILKTISPEGILSGSDLPLRTDEFVKIYGVYFVFLFFCGVFLSLNKKLSSSQLKSFRFCQALLIATSLLWFWTAYFRPLATYAILLTFILTCCTLALIRVMSFQVAICFSLVLSLVPLSRFYLRTIESKINPSAYADALTAIPTNATGRRVLNCNWDDGNFVFYFRPDLTVLDFHSPELLAQSLPAAKVAREEFRRTGKSPLEMDYVLCDLPSVYGILAQDPSYQKLFPTSMEGSASGTPYLFARISPTRKTTN